jgi:hypothetical protein
LSSPFSQRVRSGKLEKAPLLLAKHLHERGKLDLQKTFITFVGS